MRKLLFSLSILIFALCLTGCGMITKYHEDDLYSVHDNNFADFHKVKTDCPVYKATTNDLYNASPVVEGQNPGIRSAASVGSFFIDAPIETIMLPFEFGGWIIYKITK